MEETKKRPRRTFTEEFKKQMVDLYNAGKPRAEIVKEYGLTASALDRWISRINKTGSTKEKENRSDTGRTVRKNLQRPRGTKKICRT